MDRAVSSTGFPGCIVQARFCWARWGRRVARGVVCAICALGGIAGWDPGIRAVGSDPQELRKQASWSWPDPVQVRGQLEQWIDSSISGELQREAREEAASIVAQRGVLLHEAVMQVAGLLPWSR
ncbi:MAG: hypothetical protein ACOVNV_02285 [Pirellulaceae bacterium]